MQPTSSPISCSPIAASTRLARSLFCSWSRQAWAWCSASAVPQPRDVGAAEPETRLHRGEFVQNGAAVLCPLISIFAAYIVMNGHLSAGGGFQGGCDNCVRRHAASTG